MPKLLRKSFYFLILCSLGIIIGFFWDKIASSFSIVALLLIVSTVILGLYINSRNNNCRFSRMVERSDRESTNEIMEVSNRIYSALGHIFLGNFEAASKHLLRVNGEPLKRHPSLNVLAKSASFYLGVFSGRTEEARETLEEMEKMSFGPLNREKWLQKYRLVFLYHCGQFEECRDLIPRVEKSRWSKMDRMENTYIKFQVTKHLTGIADTKLRNEFLKLKGDTVVYSLE